MRVLLRRSVTDAGWVHNFHMSTDPLPHNLCLSSSGRASAHVGAEGKNVEIDLTRIRIDIPCLHAPCISGQTTQALGDRLREETELTELLTAARVLLLEGKRN